MDGRAHTALWSAMAFMASAALVAAAIKAGPKIWDQTTAAWVQAVGSILAVAAVGGVALMQAREARSLATEERREYRKTVAEFADEVAATVDELELLLIEDTQFMAYEGISMAVFDQVGRALQDFDATRLASARGALAMRDLITTVEEAYGFQKRITDSWRSDGGLDQETVGGIRWWANRFRSARAVLWEVARS